MTLFILLAATFFYGFAWLLMVLAGALHHQMGYPNLSYAESALAMVSVSFLISTYQAFRHDAELLKDRQGERL